MTAETAERRPGGVSSAEFARRYHPSVFRAAWWTYRALRGVRRELPRHGLQTRVRQPPRLSRGASRGVYAVLRRQPNTCLERTLVLQRWLASVGERHDVVVGVARPDESFSAHAWLDFESEVSTSDGFAEILRLPAPT
jgi:hypothetical protein